MDEVGGEVLFRASARREMRAQGGGIVSGISSARGEDTVVGISFPPSCQRARGSHPTCSCREKMSRHQ